MTEQPGNMPKGISVGVDEIRGGIGFRYAVLLTIDYQTFRCGTFDKETAERVATDVRARFCSPPANPSLATLARETAVACVAVAYDDQDQLRENIEYIILSALNTVRTARDTGHEAVMLLFELRMAQANEELAALSVRVARSDDEIQSVCLRQKAEIARLTADIERLAKFAHIVEHGKWRLVIQINPPSNIVKAEMLDKYGLAIASGEGADAVEALLGANAALEAMPKKKRKDGTS